MIDEQAALDMRIMLAWLTSVALRRPTATLVAVAAVTVALGALIPRAVNDDAVAVDNAASRALDELAATFPDDQSVTQVVVTTDGAPIRSADGLRAAIALQRAVRRAAGDTLVADGGQPPIVSYTADVETALASAGIDPGEVDDPTFDALVEQARSRLPAEFAGLVDALVAPSETATSTTGLLLVFQETSGLDDDAVTARQRAVAEAVASARLPDGFHADAVSLGLLLSGADIGPEIGRLFGTALALILLVLGVVYWVPRTGGTRRQLLRRTSADVAVTLVVILLAVVWMQGAGVLLGPSMLGLIGPFSPQTQIVPILIIGLGVDFGIHVLARYRTELGASGEPDASMTTALATVGPTLLLCTAATAIGFLTNLVSPVDFLATLGVLAAVGICAAFLLTVTVIASVRVLLDRRAAVSGALPIAALAAGRERVLPRLIGRTAWLARAAPRVTIAVALVAVAVGGYGFTRLDTRFEVTDFVPQDDPGLSVWETITDEFDGGFAETTSVLLTGDVVGAAEAGGIERAIAGLGRINDVETFGGRPDVTVDIAADGRVGRLEVRTSAGQSGAAVLAEDMSAALAPLEDAGLDVVVTSPQVVQAALSEDIEDAQITSLVVALGAAMLLLALAFAWSIGHAVLGVVTVLPVVLVLAATFGTMAATGIPLNAVTATLAALSIGIGVPFAIHVTARFVEERSRVDDVHVAVERTVQSTGGALAGSALTTAIGFGILVTSTLRPFEQLGYVIVYAIAYSLVVAVLVLPSLLVLTDRRRTLVPRR